MKEVQGATYCNCCGDFHGDGECSRPDLIRRERAFMMRAAEQRDAEIDFTQRTPPEADTPVSAFDKQEGGGHYTKMAIQPFQYSMANGLDPLQHTIIKYVSRFRDKNGTEDLRKAIHCIELLIEFEDKKNAG